MLSCVIPFWPFPGDRKRSFYEIASFTRSNTVVFLVHPRVLHPVYSRIPLVRKFAVRTMVLYASKLIDTLIFRLLACYRNTRHLYTTSIFLASKCFWYTTVLRYRLFCKARMGLLSYSGAFSTMNPFRTGRVRLVIGFLADIHPLSLFAAIYATSAEKLCSDFVTGGETHFS